MTMRHGFFALFFRSAFAFRAFFHLVCRRTPPRTKARGAGARAPPHARSRITACCGCCAALAACPPQPLPLASSGERWTRPKWPAGCEERSEHVAIANTALPQIQRARRRGRKRLRAQNPKRGRAKGEKRGGGRGETQREECGINSCDRADCRRLDTALGGCGGGKGRETAREIGWQAEAERGRKREMARGAQKKRWARARGREEANGEAGPCSSHGTCKEQNTLEKGEAGEPSAGGGEGGGKRRASRVQRSEKKERREKQEEETTWRVNVKVLRSVHQSMIAKRKREDNKGTPKALGDGLIFAARFPLVACLSVCALPWNFGEHAVDDDVEVCDFFGEFVEGELKGVPADLRDASRGCVREERVRGRREVWPA